MQGILVKLGKNEHLTLNVFLFVRNVHSLYASRNNPKGIKWYKKYGLTKNLRKYK